ncbi:MAG: hypothetical protein NTZ90_17960 [Proteobacteria bacterium]|nr:hypothetical protein [Pseudomonadota bacterium]
MTQAAQHVGFTRSGKAVQVPVFSDEKQTDLPAACSSYTATDHFDTYSMFEHLLSRKLSRRTADTRAMNMYQSMSSAHSLKLNDNWREAERLALGLQTIFNVLEHGKALTDGVYKD